MSQFPVHIIMERSTGKTMNCYVEFQTDNQAREAVHSVNRITDAAPLGPRMGNRQVDVSLSSQDELLKAIFPRAKSVDWVNGVPREREAREPWSAGFDGFITEEELFCVARHAKDPQRVCHEPYFVIDNKRRTNRYLRAPSQERSPSGLMNPWSAPSARYVSYRHIYIALDSIDVF